MAIIQAAYKHMLKMHKIWALSKYSGRQVIQQASARDSRENALIQT